VDDQEFSQMTEDEDFESGFETSEKEKLDDMDDDEEKGSSDGSSEGSRPADGIKPLTFANV
jgi:hypothetical protein